MDWTAPCSCRVELLALDDGLEPVGALGGVTAATVDASMDGDAPTLGTCSATLSADSPAPAVGWCRLDAVCAQGGERERVMLGCYAMAVQSAKRADGGYEVELEGGGVLSPMADVEMGAGAYAPRGSDAAAWCAALMGSSGCPSRVVAESTGALARDVVFGDSDSALDALWAVLGEAGLSVRVDGDGAVRIAAVPTEPALVIDETDGRGLRDLSVKGGVPSYTREFAPGVACGDVVRIRLPRLGLGGDYRITSQGIDLADGLAVEEELEELDG